MIRKIVFLLLIPFLSFSQEIDSLFLVKGEVFFSFTYQDKHELNKLSKIISIDHNVKRNIAYAYANKTEFKRFLLENIEYKIIEKKIFNNNTSKNTWNYYPTYQEYLNMIQSFAINYPNICKLHSLGTLNSGREILVLQISDNIGTKENEPSFLYTSSMHGDELTGYVLMLRLIDTLLSGYGIDQQLTNLINEIDIWINPLANPDGAYAGGNNSVAGATRYNANWVDLNRNYPDPEDGQHPDGNPWQDETIIFMGLADTVNFHLSANLHTGAEVVNYPWDTWSTLHADDGWWKFVSFEFANSAQNNGGSNYFDGFNNGITNGWDWYEVNGGRQDYMTYFKHGRELTLEVSNDKTPDPNMLTYYWNANYESLINYMKQSLYGLRGLITDSLTGKAIKAKIQINSHDIDSSHIYSSLPIGNYHRFIDQGNYNFTFSKTGYHSKTISSTILNNSITILDVQLTPLNINNLVDIEETKKINRNIDVLGRETIRGNLILKIFKGKSVKKVINLE